VLGLVDAIFYLSVLRAATNVETAPDATARQARLAEGWAYWQTLRPTVAGASPAAAQTIESVFTRDPSEAFPAATTASVYAALNEQPVLRALGIPSNLVVRTAPAQ
jgi:hypothetical protein